jgi:ectoine hydroxylase-related dioxygenase (phytanoyl-CoA dioxygenase family)
MKALTSEQKTFFDDNGYLVLPGFYDEATMAEMRDQFHDLIANTDGRPAALRYSYMDPAEGYEIDPYNPKNVRGIMDQTLANDYWYNQFLDPRIIEVLIDLFGPDIDFHNGKVRNNPPGFVNDQSWHQDWPYELHTKPELAAAITYLDETDVDQGATSVIPGSHKRGEWPTLESSHTIPDTEVAEVETLTVKTRPGDVLFIHVQVVHTAGHNFTNVSRHKIINEYKTKSAVDCWGNRCAFAGLPLARNGKIVTHPV